MKDLVILKFNCLLVSHLYLEYVITSFSLKLPFTNLFCSSIKNKPCTGPKELQ